MSNKRAYFWLSLALTVLFFGWAFIMWPGTRDGSGSAAAMLSFLLDVTIYFAAIMLIWAHALFWGPSPKSR